MNEFAKIVTKTSLTNDAFLRFMNYSSLPSLMRSLCVAGAAVILLPSCLEDPKQTQAITAAQQEIDSLKLAKSALESDVKLLRQEAEKRQNELQRRTDELQKEADEAKAQLEQAQDEATEVRKELEEYMAKYKLGYRAKLKGTSLPALKTEDGHSYESVVVREITPVEISFVHSMGVARVPLARLTADLQRKFMFDPDEEKKKEEAAQAAAAKVANDLEEIGGIEGIDIPMAPKDPARVVNPIVVHNLKQRILTRQEAIEKANAEARQVKSAGDDRQNLGKLRLQVLGQRVERMREEIKELANLLDKELNG